MAISNDEILNVSLTLFSQNGYDGTSLQDIADCLKVTKGALFKHYDSKEALWNALIDKVEVYYNVIDVETFVDESVDQLCF